MRRAAVQRQVGQRFAEHAGEFESVAAAAAGNRHVPAGDLRMIGFLSDIRVHYVDADAVQRLDPQGLSFFNANTPEEWQAVLERHHA